MKHTSVGSPSLNIAIFLTLKVHTSLCKSVVSELNPIIEYPHTFDSFIVAPSHHSYTSKATLLQNE